VDGTEIFTVPFDPNQLGLTPYVNMNGSFKVEDVGVHTIHTPTAMFVPFELVSLLLGKDNTAKEAFQLSLPLLEAKCI
jgi:hypothetical protein